MEEKKERLFGSNIFGGQRENKNTAEGLWGVEGDAVATCPRSVEGACPGLLRVLPSERALRADRRAGEPTAETGKAPVTTTGLLKHTAPKIILSDEKMNALKKKKSKSKISI